MEEDMENAAKERKSSRVADEDANKTSKTEYQKFTSLTELLQTDKPTIVKIPVKRSLPNSKMVVEAIGALKQSAGSSPEAISKFIKDNYDLLDNFGEILSKQLRSLTKKGKIVRVGNTFKMAARNSEETVGAAATAVKDDNSGRKDEKSAVTVNDERPTIGCLRPRLKPHRAAADDTQINNLTPPAGALFKGSDPVAAFPSAAADDNSTDTVKKERSTSRPFKYKFKPLRTDAANDTEINSSTPPAASPSAVADDNSIVIVNDAADDTQIYSFSSVGASLFTAADDNLTVAVEEESSEHRASKFKFKPLRTDVEDTQIHSSNPVRPSLSVTADDNSTVTVEDERSNPRHSKFIFKPSHSDVVEDTQIPAAAFPSVTADDYSEITVNDEWSNPRASRFRYKPPPTDDADDTQIDSSTPATASPSAAADDTQVKGSTPAASIRTSLKFKLKAPEQKK